jgi:hypothetical protein
MSSVAGSASTFHIASSLVPSSYYLLPMSYSQRILHGGIVRYKIQTNFFHFHPTIGAIVNPTGCVPVYFLLGGRLP